MAELRIQVDEDMLAKLQRLAAKDNKTVEEAAAYELKLALDRQLRYLNYAVIDVFTEAARELRIPLGAVIAFAETLVTEYNGEINEVAQEDLAQVLNSGKHVWSIAANLVELFNIEQGGMPVEFRELDILQLLQEVTTQYQVRFQLLSALPMIRADGGRISQVLETCITLLHYSDELVLSARFEQPTLILTLAVPKIVPTKFEDFEQSNTLILARYLVHAHHGTLTVDSDADHELMITIMLPVNAEVAHAEAGN